MRTLNESAERAAHRRCSNIKFGGCCRGGGSRLNHNPPAQTTDRHGVELPGASTLVGIGDFGALALCGRLVYVEERVFRRSSAITVVGFTHRRLVSHCMHQASYVNGIRRLCGFGGPGRPSTSVETFNVKPPERRASRRES